MSLVSCRECGTDVSYRAKSCPRCGASKPGRTWGEMAAVLVALVALGISVAMCSGHSNSTGTSTQTDEAWLRLHGTDPKALDERFGEKAEASCSLRADDFLRSISAHDFSWDSDTEGLFGVKFGQYSTSSAGNNLLTLISERAKLSNAFGGFTHIRFYCLYDVANDEVIRFSQSDPASEVPIPDERPMEYSVQKPSPIIINSAAGGNDADDRLTPPITEVSPDADQREPNGDDAANQ